MQPWRPLFLLSFLLAVPASAAPPVVYHSPADDGVNPVGPVEVPSLQPSTLHLYLDGGSVPSVSDPCHQGGGDEVCGWNLTLSGQAGLSLVDFTATGDVVWSLAGDVLRCTGIEPVTGALGPMKIGDLVVNGSQGGSFHLTAGESIDASLGIEVVAPRTLVTLPEPTGGAAAGALGVLLLARRRVRRSRP